MRRLISGKYFAAVFSMLFLNASIFVLDDFGWDRLVSAILSLLVFSLIEFTFGRSSQGISKIKLRYLQDRVVHSSCLKRLLGNNKSVSLTALLLHFFLLYIPYPSVLLAFTVIFVYVNENSLRSLFGLNDKKRACNVYQGAQSRFAIAYYPWKGGHSHIVDQWEDDLQKAIGQIDVVYIGGSADSSQSSDRSIVYCEDLRDATEKLKNRKAIFFVADSIKNCELIVKLKREAPEVKHIFLNHGDSLKSCNLMPSLRMYDFLVVAGGMSKELYTGYPVEISESRVVVIGRPQIEVGVGKEKTMKKANSSPVKILYAITWEGISEKQNYSSIYSALETVAKLLIDIPEASITIRLHPSLGIRCKDALRLCRELIRYSRRNERLYVDSETRLYRQFDGADLLISDESSLIVDFMAWEKPVICVKPSREVYSPSYVQHKIHTTTADNYVAIHQFVVGCASGDELPPSPKVREWYLSHHGEDAMNNFTSFMSTIDDNTNCAT